MPLYRSAESLAQGVSDTLDLPGTYVPQPATLRQAQRWSTTVDGAIALEQSAAPPFSAVTPGSGDVVVRADRRWPVFGVGAALTDSAAYNLTYRLTAAQRTALLTELYVTNGWNFLRVAFGCTDFQTTGFLTYDDLAGGATDPDMAEFDLGQDLKYLIPTAREILAIKPSVKVVASVWNPPWWMSTPNNTFSTEPNTAYFTEYAAYIVKCIQSWEALGIPIWAVNPKNEPNAAQGGTWTTSDWISFVGTYLGPAIDTAGLSTKILAWDANWNTYTSVQTLMADATVAPYVAGFAWHGYDGTPSNQEPLRRAWPDRFHLMTERRTLFENVPALSDGPNDWSESMVIAARNCIIGHLRHGGAGTIFWNMVLDETGGPGNGSAPGRRGVVTVNSSTAEITRNAEYYALSHLGRLAGDGAYYIDSTSYAGAVETAAVLNRDGSTGLYAYNAGASETTFNVIDSGSGLGFPVTMQVGEVATWSWGPGTSSPVGVAFAASAPAQPTLTAVGGPAGVQLSWSAPASDAPIIGYEIWRGTSAGTLARVREVGASVASVFDNVNAATYYYALKAVSVAGVSDASATVSAVSAAGSMADLVKSGTIYTGTTTVNDTTLTVSGVTVGTGSKRALVVAVGTSAVGTGADPDTISGVAFGGTALTQIGFAGTTGGSSRNVSLWQLVNPTSGATDDVVLTAKGATGIAATCVYFEGIDQTTPAGTPDTGTSASATSVSSTVTGTGQDLILAVGCGRTTATAITPSSTSAVISQVATGSNTRTAVSLKTATGAAQASSFSMSTTADNMATMSVALQGSRT